LDPLPDPFVDKIDYVFFSGRDLVEPHGGSTTTDVFDHLPLRGRASLTGPRRWRVFRVGTPVSLAASYTDPGANDTHTCPVAWEDGTEETYLPGSGDSCDRLHTFTPGGCSPSTRR
jgi:hypothetical protein